MNAYNTVLLVQTTMNVPTSSQWQNLGNKVWAENIQTK